MKKELTSLIVLIFIISPVLAGMAISETKSLYNLADSVKVRIDGILGAPSGNFNVNLVCSNSSFNLVKIPAISFSQEDESSYEFTKELKLLDLEIGSYEQIIGTCQIISLIGSDSASTKSFQITRDVIVSNTFTNQTTFNPTDQITLNIKATKANGQPLNGFIQGSNATTFNTPIEKGELKYSFFMPSTSEPGSYNLVLEAYDIEGEERLNKGRTVVIFSIRQIPTSIILSLESTEAVPGSDFSIGAEVVDQSGKRIEGIVDLALLSPDGKETKQPLFSGEIKSINFKKNATAGTWAIYTILEGLEELREFQVLENPEVEFEVVDSVLYVRNIGNALYNKSINVRIGGETLYLDLNIDIGETRKFLLEGPGEQEVVISDGQKEFSGRVLLTGNAVSVKDFKDVGIFKSYSVIWIFLIVILGGVGIVFFIRYRKTKTLGSGTGLGEKGKGIVNKVFHPKISSKFKSGVSNSMNFTNKSADSQSLDEKNYKDEDKSLLDLTSKKIGSAESALVLKGEKYPSSILTLKIKNFSTLNKNSRENLKKIVESTKESKGLVNWMGEYILVIFSPIVSKTYKNEILAVKCAFTLLKGLQDHNKKFSDKIEFNIGVNSGDLIASKEQGKLKYTSIGNTISFSKRISDSNEGKILVSDAVRKKLLRDIKVTKAGAIGENNLFEVSSVKDKEANEAKLKELLKRM